MAHRGAVTAQSGARSECSRATRPPRFMVTLRTGGSCAAPGPSSSVACAGAVHGRPGVGVRGGGKRAQPPVVTGGCSALTVRSGTEATRVRVGLDGGPVRLVGHHARHGVGRSRPENAQRPARRLPVHGILAEVGGGVETAIVRVDEAAPFVRFEVSGAGGRRRSTVNVPWTTDGGATGRWRSVLVTRRCQSADLPRAGRWPNLGSTSFTGKCASEGAPDDPDEVLHDAPIATGEVGARGLSRRCDACGRHRLTFLGGSRERALASRVNMVVLGCRGAW